jgi:hypothetical protein
VGKKKTNNALFWIIAVIAVAAGIWYVQQPSDTPMVAPTPTPEVGAQDGDLVSVNYVLRMANGTVVDTNDVALAQEYGLKNYVTGPFRFVIGQSGKVKGFDEKFVGMQPGDNKTTLITASEPVLEYRINLTRSITRNQQVPRFQPLSHKYFEKNLNRTAKLNDVIVHPSLPWPIKVVNVTEKYAVVEPLVEEGKSYQLPGLEWKSALLLKSKNDMMFRHNPAEGQIIHTEFGEATVGLGVGRINVTYHVKPGDTVQYGVPLEEGTGSIPYTFEIKEVTPADFLISRINFPAQETLKLTATMLDWQQDVQKTKWMNKDNATA